MKAFVCKKYGPPEVLSMVKVAKPIPKEKCEEVQNWRQNLWDNHGIE